MLPHGSERASRCQAVAATIADMPRDWSASTFGERVAFVAAKFPTQNKLGVAAGIESGPLSRLVNTKTRTAGNRSADLVTRIARAGGVSTEWLSTGEGQPETASEASSAAAPVAYPSKLSAAKGMEGLVDPQAIAAMMTEEHRGSDEDPGPEFWTERILWWQRERERRRAQLAEPAPADEPPPMAPRPRRSRP